MLGILSDDFDGPWVQVYGTAEVLDMPEAAEPFVDYLPRERTAYGHQDFASSTSGHRSSFGDVQRQGEDYAWCR